MDISAGTTQKQQAADFPNGVPAVSDSSQTAWMQYVYQQGPCPTNAQGVTVTLSTIDPNGNTYVIGTLQPTHSACLQHLYTSKVPGTYKVFATFAGTDSYWQSSSETAFNVMSSTKCNSITNSSSYTINGRPILPAALNRNDRRNHRPCSHSSLVNY